MMGWRATCRCHAKEFKTDHVTLTPLPLPSPSTVDSPHSTGWAGCACRATDTLWVFASTSRLLKNPAPDKLVRI
jgi:hypothetical protein